LTNYGYVTAAYGTLTYGNGIDSGTMDIAHGATLDLSGSSFQFVNPGVLTVNGTLITQSGTISLLSSATAAILDLRYGGTTTINSALVVTNSIILSYNAILVLSESYTIRAGVTFQWNFGTVSGSGVLEISEGSQLTLVGGNEGPYQKTLSTSLIIRGTAHQYWCWWRISSGVSIINYGKLLIEDFNLLPKI
jgi:hypothetical protein